jgi:hypothetical protein
LLSFAVQIGSKGVDEQTLRFPVRLEVRRAGRDAHGAAVRGETEADGRNAGVGIGSSAAGRARLCGRPVPDPADSAFDEAGLDRLCQRFERRLSGKPEAANGAGRAAPPGGAGADEGA